MVVKSSATTSSAPKTGSGAKASAAKSASRGAAKKTTAATKATSKTTAKTASKSTTAKAAPARSTAPSKATAKKAAPAKTTAAKRAAVKSAAVKSAAKKAPATKAAPAKATATKTASTKAASSAAKTTTAKAAPAKARTAKESSTQAATTWSAAEVKELRATIESEIERLTHELDEAQTGLAGLVNDTQDTAGDDQADVGSKAIEREQGAAVVHNTRELLEGYQHALVRVDEGRQGVCERCGGPIPKERVQAFPRAALCVDCKSAMERR